MLEDFYLPMRLAVWNRARSVWETGQMQFLCEHSVPFLATWPTSGMTRSGQAFELPTPELHTGGSASSLLRTPVAAEGSGGAKSPATSHQVMLRDQVTDMLPTPRAVEAGFSLTAPAAMRHAAIGMGALTEVIGYSLLKTPTSQLAINGGSQHPDKRKAGGHGPTLADEVEHLLPTPQVADATGGHASRSGARSGELLLPGVVKTLIPTGESTDPRSEGGKR